MTHRQTLAGLLAFAAIAGCAPVAGAPTTPGASSAAAIGANLGANLGGAAGTTTGTTTTTGGGTATGTVTGNLNADLAKIYKQGRKWTYAITSSVGAAAAGTYTDEVVSVAGNVATVKHTVSSPAASTSETKIDLTAKDFAAAFAKADASVTYAFDAGSTSESVTTPAGTFTCTKITGKTKVVAQGASSESDSVTWYDTSVGLIKQTTTSKVEVPNMPAMPSIPGMPAGSIPGMPSGGGLSGIVTTIELQKLEN